MKYCKDCKWMRRGIFTSLPMARCVQSEVIKINGGGRMGDGYISPKLVTVFASLARKYSNKCGPDAKYWEPR